MFANWFAKGLLNLKMAFANHQFPGGKGTRCLQTCFQTVCKLFRAIYELFRALYELFSLELRTDMMTWHHPTPTQTDRQTDRQTTQDCHLHCSSETTLQK
jgi:hypothetical protein